MRDVASLIIGWFLKNKRSLPWRKEKNAYHILLSEIIMQQTRIEQGIPYFFKIIEAFPTIETLAAADEELLLRYWQGLGYYSRAKNLHVAAKNIVENYNGLIPNSFSELKKMKGIGAYTAAAIASIAFDEPVPVIDGNVMRVVARLFAIEDPVNETIGKNKIQTCLNTIFDTEQPGIFNEAIMEFGALQCVPSNPDCEKCPLTKHCAAHKMSKVNFLPLKRPLKKVKIRYLNYLFLLIEEHSTLMKQRRTNDIWKNLYEFPLIETEQFLPETILRSFDFWKSFSFLRSEKDITFQQIIHYQHKLTHRLLKITFTLASMTSFCEQLPTDDFVIMTLSEAENKPKPILLAKFLDKVTNDKNL